MKAVALTGTPGTGKSTISRVLKERGHSVVEVMELVRRTGTSYTYSARDRCHVVDTDELTERSAALWRAGGDGVTIVEGHLAHYASCDMAIVLRCSPSELSARLVKRGWKKAKIQDNVRSEVLDVILIEAMERIKCIHEMDTSIMTPADAADAVETAMSGRSSNPPVASRWRGEIEKWF